MKRIAAIITLVFAALAIPATAMANTSGSGSGDNYGYTKVDPGGQLFAVCPLPRGIRGVKAGKAVQIRYAKGQAKIAFRKMPRKAIRFFCRMPRKLLPEPPAQVCAAGAVTFDMPPSSGTFTEYSGPQMYVGENFGYNGTSYTVASVSGAVFTLDANGQQFVNGGVSVVDGLAKVGCADRKLGS